LSTPLLGVLFGGRLHALPRGCQRLQRFIMVKLTFFLGTGGGGSGSDGGEVGGCGGGNGSGGDNNGSD
jgi:hypothetical protein